MAAATLALEGVVQLVTFASFAYVGNVLRQRHGTAPGADLARNAIVAWWWGLGAYLGMLGALDLVAFAGFAPFWLFLGARIVGVALLALCAWGFSTYVLFLYAGSPRATRWTALYGVLAAILFYVETITDNSTTVLVSDWSAGLAPPADRGLLNAVYAFFAIPLLVSILAYASLFARVQQPLQRYRIALVSGTLFAWVVGGFVGASSGSGLGEFLAVTILGLVAAFAVLLAYRPPGAVLARLAPDSPEARARDMRISQRRGEFRQRAGELI